MKGECCKCNDEIDEASDSAYYDAETDAWYCFACYEEALDGR